MQSGIDIFVLISGSFRIVATVPLIYLAIRSVRDARDVRRVQFPRAGRPGHRAPAAAARPGGVQPLRC